MHYNIRYSCICHIGNTRSINQDNFVCDNRYLEINDVNINLPLCGIKSTKEVAVFGVFDGMGGEECGEIASYIAAKDAASLNISQNSVADLLQFCNKANNDICTYASKHEIAAMGTTAAILIFASNGITLCNIGDTKIYRFSDGILEQISKDHVAVAAYGMKPPLSQNLGIPPDELLIDPYLAQGPYNEGDVYLICSDGLTDMVSTNEITSVLAREPIAQASVTLLEKALRGGGKDNTTIILCKIERKLKRPFWRKRKRQKKEV